MKSYLLFLVVFFRITAFAQIPKSAEIYPKMENYYRQHFPRVDYIERVFKPVLQYDTIHSKLALVTLSDKSYLMLMLDTDFLIKNALLFSEDHYFIPQGTLSKIKLSKKDLDGTIYTYVERFPSQYFDKLENNFGKIQDLRIENDQYIAFPKKSFLVRPISGALTSVLKIDTLHFRINSLIQTANYKGDLQFNEYKYPQLPDSIEQYILTQAMMLAEASKEYPVTTFKEMYKSAAPVENFEGKSFDFKQLISFNQGPILDKTAGKYIIFDFFYQSCLPCHKMTGYILDWLPGVDSSRIVLVGIDPNDSEWSMKMFVKDKKINYPVIIGDQAREIIRYYHVHSYPTLMLVSPDGIIQTIHEGMSKSFLTKAEKLLNR
ncbi:MAG TPA: TlpA disulfide reductase family protein [Chitinophagaceae bacterium]|nr:TlpA disulfide reductase family protein [Chitinophagaceae bacterium]